MERGGEIVGAFELGALTAHRGAKAADYIVAMRRFMQEAQNTGMIRGATFYLDKTINIMSILPLSTLVLEGCEFVLLSKVNVESMINISGSCTGLTLQVCHFTRLKPHFFKL